MKNQTKMKMGTAALVLFMLFALNGCSRQTTKGISDEAPLDRRIGLISALGNIPNVKGTHILTLDDGSTILLKSLAINMDEPKYKNKRVEVAGVTNYSSDGKQSMMVENIDVLEEVVPNQIATPTSWKEYTSPGLGFTIKYRDDFEVKDVPNGESGVLFWNAEPLDASTQTQVATQQPLFQATQQGATGYGVKITLMSAKSMQDLLASLSLKSDSPNDLLAGGYVQSKIGPDGLYALKKVDSTGKIIDFYVNDNPKFFHISFDAKGLPQDKLTSPQNIFYVMLGSFKVSVLPIQPTQQVGTQQKKSTEQAAANTQSSTNKQ